MIPGLPGPPSHTNAVSRIRESIESLRGRTVVLFGGKGGMGRTTTIAHDADVMRQLRMTRALLSKPRGMLSARQAVGRRIVDGSLPFP